MSEELIKPRELDRILRYPSGKSERLARRGKLPHVVLPDGSIRFESQAIERMIADNTRSQESGASNGL